MYFSKNDPSRGKGNRLRAFPNPENAFLTLIQGKIEFLKRNSSFSAISNSSFSLNQAQGSIFRIRESIPQIKLPLET
jgi:hypothetical protein